MKTFMLKVLSRLYQYFSGINVNYLRQVHADMLGSVSALETMATVQVEKITRSDWVDTFGGIANDQDCRDMAELFKEYGSDKSTKHNYHLIYASLLKGERQVPLHIFEIGLGTNDPHHASSMGVNGKPGASLRAFRDWAPKAILYGADNDKTTLFSEERISTYFVDQTIPETFKHLVASLPKEGFDLIIDDGLHTPWANLNTVNFGLTMLKPGGVLVVEDILDQYLPWWNVAAALLSKNYDCQLVKMQAETVFIIRKKR